MSEVKKSISKKKAFILDTCVLLHDPHCIDKFGDNIVIIPIWAVEELDGIKKGRDQVGEDAREVSRILDEYRKQGSLAKGVPTKAGGLIIIDYNGNDFSMLPVGLERSRDNRILLVAKAWQDSNPNRPQQKKQKGAKTQSAMPDLAFSEVQIVTKDTNLRLKADACGIPSDDYLNDKLVKDISQLYTGITRHTLSENMLSLLDGRSPIWTSHQIPVSLIDSEINIGDLLHNQCCYFDICGKTLSAIYKKDRGYFNIINKQLINGDGIKPTNQEQWLAYYLAMDQEISLVTLGGHAGTGKTLMALLAGYHQYQQGLYDQILIYRPNCAIGEDLGFLPGDIDEKFAPWTEPIIDNMRLILGNEIDTGKNHECKGRFNPIAEMIAEGSLKISPITYIRGRSLHRVYVIVDEGQNLTPHQAKTVASRAGEGSKIVFTGDIMQIDNPRVDSISNGLAYTAESMKDLDCTGHVTLIKSERSRLAELVATRM